MSPRGPTAALVSLSGLLVAVSCLQTSTSPLEESERAGGTGPVAVQDDDPFGSDPDLGSTIGGGEPASSVWGPPESTPSIGEPAEDPGPDPGSGSGGDPQGACSPGTPTSTCAERYEDCVASAPTSCLKRSGGKTLCQRCLERCNAGDPPSPACLECRF
jgi:hypothetical protein